MCFNAFKDKRRRKRREEEEQRVRKLSENESTGGTHMGGVSASRIFMDKDLQIAKKLERSGRKNWTGAAGEGDNRKSVHLVKWMNTGKKRMGTHYCR